MPEAMRKSWYSLSSVIEDEKNILSGIGRPRELTSIHDAGNNIG